MNECLKNLDKSYVYVYNNKKGVIFQLRFLYKVNLNNEHVFEVTHYPENNLSYLKMEGID